MRLEQDHLVGLGVVGFILLVFMLLVPRPECSYKVGTGKDAITKTSFDKSYCFGEKARREQDANGS